MRFRRRHARSAERRQLAMVRARLERVQQQWPEVHAAVAALDAHAQRNGFADAIRVAMGVRDR